MGINDRRFSSRPIQIISQLEDEIVKIVPIISVEENRIIYGSGENIKEEGSRTLHLIVRSYVVHRAFLIFVILRSLLFTHEVVQ